MKFIIETYGCQMNVADSEVVASLLVGAGHLPVENIEDADIILINTCSIRDNAEQKIYSRLAQLRVYKQKNRELVIGVIGCMAERLKDKFINAESIVDIVAGPDTYRRISDAVAEAVEGKKSVDIALSQEETYSDILPLRHKDNGVSAYISIMRGCNNFCTYCVVPYLRGRERSRDPQTIIAEAEKLFSEGYREITLLGQNVNSYLWDSGAVSTTFPMLIEKMAAIDPHLRVRFATSHPKDLSDNLIEVIAKNENICSHIHLPLQSGSNRILQLMNRKYTREWYMERLAAIKQHIPDCAISTDIIAGFCSETEEDHKDTLSLMEWACYDFAYMFRYSERPGTRAAEKLKDDVPEEVKIRRLNEIIALQNSLAEESKRIEIGKTVEVLVDGFSKRSDDYLCGRTNQNKVVVFPKLEFKRGEYVKVVVERATSATLIGRVATT